MTLRFLLGQSIRLFTGLVGLALSTIALADPPREKIGESFGKPVYRDELRLNDKVPLSRELHRIFAVPAIAKYRKEHRAEITPTEEEIQAAQKYFDREHTDRIKDEAAELRRQLEETERKLKKSDLTKDERRELEIQQTVLEGQLTPPGRMFAEFMLNSWKFQRHLFDTYGGGRILWQQAGLEAYDANRKWLEHLEQQGDFSITDPKLRATFYEYWTNQEGSSFLTADPERIRKEFLEPGWTPKLPAKPNAKRLE